MATFDQAYKITSGHEGGYANNPADTGGETYAGISRKWNGSWPGWVKVDAAKKRAGNTDRLDKILAGDLDLQADIFRFYKINYFDANNLSALVDQKLAEKLYDIGVNMGVRKAAEVLQEAINLTNNNGRAYANIAQDGKVGKATIGAANGHPRKELLYKVVQALQAERYLNIMRNNPSQEVFAATWFSRV